MTKHAWRIAMAGLAILPFVYGQRPEFDRARQIISRTIDDLHHIQRHEAFAREDRERYERAMRDLEDSRHDLDENRLDRPRIDRVIQDVERVAHYDAVGPRERDALMRDVNDLRHLRDDWHHWR